MLTKSYWFKIFFSFHTIKNRPDNQFVKSGSNINQSIYYPIWFDQTKLLTFIELCIFLN